MICDGTISLIFDQTIPRVWRRDFPSKTRIRHGGFADWAGTRACDNFLSSLRSAGPMRRGSVSAWGLTSLSKGLPGPDRRIVR